MAKRVSKKKPSDSPAASSQEQPESRLDRVLNDWRQLHLWQIQPVRDILLLAAIFGVLYLGYILSVVTVPILLALAFAYLFEPVVARLVKIEWMNRQKAVIAIIASAVLVVVVPLGAAVAFAIVQGAGLLETTFVRAGTLVNSVQIEDSAPTEVGIPPRTPSAQDAYVELPYGSWRSFSDFVVDLYQRQWLYQSLREDESRDGNEDSGRTEHDADRERNERARNDPPDDDSEPLEPVDVETLTEAKPELSSFDRAVLALTERASQVLSDTAPAIGEQAFRGGMDVVSAAVSAVSSLGVLLFGAFLTAFFFYFFSTGYGRVLQFWKSLIPERRKGMVVDLAGQMNEVISGFVRGRLTIAFIQSIVFSIGFWVIGVPAAFILGPVVAILSIVPYAALIGIPIAVSLLALEAHSGIRGAWWWILGAPVVFYFLGQALDDYIWTPRIQGESTGMDTPSILFASIAGGVLAGVYGLLLAIPVAACIKILLRELFWPRFKAWAHGEERDFLPISRE